MRMGIPVEKINMGADPIHINCYEKNRIVYSILFFFVIIDFLRSNPRNGCRQRAR